MHIFPNIWFKFAWKIAYYDKWAEKSHLSEGMQMENSDLPDHRIR